MMADGTRFTGDDPPVNEQAGTKIKTKVPFMTRMKALLMIMAETFNWSWIYALTDKVIPWYRDMDGLPITGWVFPDLTVANVLAGIITSLIVFIPVFVFGHALRSYLFKDPEYFFMSKANWVRTGFWLLLLVFVFALEYGNFVGGAQLEADIPDCNPNNILCNQAEVEMIRERAEARLENAPAFASFFSLLNLATAFVVALIFKPKGERNET